MPFGDPARRCRCGARGCWNTSLDGRALARLLHQRVPANDVGYLRRVLASARAGQPGALSAIRAVAGSIGRGIAGLVNGLDPHLVVVGGLGPELLHIAADEVTAAYHDGLMAFRAVPPPPIVPARLGSDAPLLGAADEAFALLLTDEGLSRTDRNLMLEPAQRDCCIPGFAPPWTAPSCHAWNGSGTQPDARGDLIRG